MKKNFGGKVKDGIWKRITNKDICDFFLKLSVTGVVKAQRLRWIGHVIRMEQHVIPKMLMTHSKRRLGRPRLRCKNKVEEDTKNLDMRQWKEKARDTKL